MTKNGKINILALLLLLQTCQSYSSFDVNKDDNGVIVLDQRNFKTMMRIHSVVILYFYKLREQKTEVLNNMFGFLGKELNELYPFAKVAAGTDNYEKARALPDIAIFVNNKVKFRYYKGANLQKIYQFLKESLSEIDLPIPEEVEAKVKVNLKNFVADRILPNSKAKPQKK